MAIQFEEFAASHGITSSYEDADMNPSMTDDEWARTARHYKVTVKRGKKSISFAYSKGSALEYGVTTAEALEAIWNDVTSVLPYAGINWREWAHDLGFEIDDDRETYRRAEKAWKASLKMVKEANRLLKPDKFRQFIELEGP